jgi:hypothetical protein
MVPNLTSEAFIAALKPFIVRRELVDYLCSDKDSNVVGVSRELKNLLKSQEILRQANDCSKVTISLEIYSSKFTPYWKTVGSWREVLIA